MKGELVYPRGGKGKPGKVVGTRRCQLEGCTGTRLIVKWPDGKRTMPCTKGCAMIRDNAWIIL